MRRIYITSLLLIFFVSHNFAQPAARVNDPTAHGGTIITGSPNVLIGGMPAARVTDWHNCPLHNPDGSPHYGGPIMTGSPTVLISGLPAARVGDICTCNGPVDQIILGSMTVLIGGGYRSNEVSPNIEVPNSEEDDINKDEDKGDNEEVK